ncbi:MAG: YceI family protein [Flavobacterium sp.]|jgi:polyisoprenoid-binding protein YceI|uniref:YceI family protein n=1 Tax=unclassified Flavobacterium TaxID=196869 RepID=UPI000EB28B57|nr:MULTISPECIES: YceI family protein [unclassified Flavobacterium]MDP3681258.1 YceI family protein [Flavobacterium sp.]MDZ4331843.1 YceI family protein [Flavobacterium sp.]RKS15049.1 polyisoprenoid-binding protein YceI [Flavobacterium sp. 120]
MSTTKWVIDPTHSEIGFKVKHMMFTNVSGKFSKFDATIEAEDNDFENAKIEFTGAIDSITTGNADRDTHLLSPDFFDAAQFPEIKFSATSFTKINEGEYELVGDLTLHGVTKSVKLAAEYGGLMKDPWGNTKMALALEGKINRKDWGLNWNSALETGGVLVSEEVRLNIELQFLQQ